MPHDRRPGDFNPKPGDFKTAKPGSKKFQKLGLVIEQQRKAAADSLTTEEALSLLSPSITSIDNFMAWLTEELTTLRFSNNGWRRAVDDAYSTLEDIGAMGYPPRPAIESGHPKASCERALVDLAAWARRSPAQVPTSIGETERAIIMALHNSHPARLRQVDIESRTKFTRKIIGPALESLRSADWTHRPAGIRGGEALTAAGIGLAEKLKAQSTR